MSTTITRRRSIAMDGVLVTPENPRSDSPFQKVAILLPFRRAHPLVCKLQILQAMRLISLALLTILGAAAGCAPADDGLETELVPSEDKGDGNAAWTTFRFARDTTNLAFSYRVDGPPIWRHQTVIRVRPSARFSAGIASSLTRDSEMVAYVVVSCTSDAGVVTASSWGMVQAEIIDGGLVYWGYHADRDGEGRRLEDGRASTEWMAVAAPMTCRGELWMLREIATASWFDGLEVDVAVASTQR
jgi:hypothetical protein